MKYYLFSLLIIPYFCLIPPPSFNFREKRGIIIKVVDGDTVVAQVSKQRIRIRLNYIDAPEIDQVSKKEIRVGINSQKYLINLVLNKMVKIRLYRKDFYKRWLGELYLKGLNINQDMVASGQAYLYPYGRYLSKLQKLKYFYAQKQAKDTKRGVWGSGRVLRPWSYRKRKRKNRTGKGKKKGERYTRKYRL